MKLKKKYDIGVVGLGYVGLTLATVLAEVGYSVLGVEKRKEVVDLTNKGEPHFSEAGLKDALGRVVRQKSLVASEVFEDDISCNTYIITVGTPLSKDGFARLDFIEEATKQVANNMTDGALIILRSTVKIGTVRNIVSPILKSTGKNFDIAMCPERTLEGSALKELRELPQIVGADTQFVADRASKVFKRITNSIVEVSSLESAEIIKLVDNTFRDVQFAFANEIARLCDVFGVNAFEVINMGKLGYMRTNLPLPGLVGGPCLEKDPHILFQSAKDHGIDLEITQAARLVNERQPSETMSFIKLEASKRSLPHDIKITIMGMAFKGLPETNDLRGSMSIHVLDELLKIYPYAEICLYDPVITSIELKLAFPNQTVLGDQEKSIRGSSVLIIANNHPNLKNLSISQIKALMKSNGFIYDYWNHFSNLTKLEIGDSYFAVGNSKRHSNE
jgi:UDP-N-acetyl-D-mannosaminuronic acid dehydrogenase